MRAKYKTNVDRLVPTHIHLWGVEESNCVQEAFDKKGYPCFVTHNMGNDSREYNSISIQKGYVPLEGICDFLGSQRLDMEIHYQSHEIVILLLDNIEADELIRKMKYTLSRRG